MYTESVFQESKRDKQARLSQFLRKYFLLPSLFSPPLSLFFLLSTMLNLFVIQEIIKHLKFRLKKNHGNYFLLALDSLLFKRKANSSSGCERTFEQVRIPWYTVNTKLGHSTPCSGNSRTLLIMKGKSFQPERGKVSELKLMC